MLVIIFSEPYNYISVTNHLRITTYIINQSDLHTKTYITKAL